MTEATAGPELETSTPRGSRVLGMLGAFLGALLGDLLWLFILFVIPSESEFWKLALLGGVLAGFCSCWGYRLFRGRRNMKFAWWTVRLCVVLTTPLALALFSALVALSWAGGWWYGPRVIWLALCSSVELLVAERQWQVVLVFSLTNLFFARLSAPLLLKYADPDWYRSPRRIAQSNGGGALFNHPKIWPLPEAASLPTTFTVDKGKLTVEGDTITAKRFGKTPRVFSVQEVAGVVLGPGSGFNVLYDKDEQILAKFAWSRRGAETFGQYLLHHGVPFVDLNAQPVQTTPQAVELPRQFTVREGKLVLWVGVICLAVFGCLAVLSLFVMDELAILVALMVFLFFVLMGVWMLLSYKNRRLEVDGEDLTYTTAFGRTTRFRLSQVDSFRFRLGVGTRELRDREGKLLARYEDNMENALLLTAYLTQHQVPAGPSKSRKD